MTYARGLVQLGRYHLVYLKNSTFAPNCKSIILTYAKECFFVGVGIHIIY